MPSAWATGSDSRAVRRRSPSLPEETHQYTSSAMTTITAIAT